MRHLWFVYLDAGFASVVRDGCAADTKFLRKGSDNLAEIKNAAGHRFRLAAGKRNRFDQPLTASDIGCGLASAAREVRTT